MKRRVVVTGIGCGHLARLQGGRSSGLASATARAGSVRSSVSTLPNYRVRFGGEVRDWSVDGYIEAKDEKKLDRFAQFAHRRRRRRRQRLGHRLLQGDPCRCGVMLGSGIGGLETIETQHERLLDKGPGQGLGLHHPQADRQRGQRPAVDPVRAARAQPGASSPPAPARPTPSATPFAADPATTRPT